MRTAVDQVASAPSGAAAQRSPLARRVWRSATQRVMSLTMGGMAVGLALDLLLAARLGAGPVSDAVILALTVPLLVDTVTREGTKFSLVPYFMKNRVALDEVGYGRLVSGLLNFALVVGGILGGAFMVGAPLIIAVVAPGLDADARAEATSLLQLSAPLAIFAPGISVQGSQLNSLCRFNLVALRNAVAPGTVVIGVLLLWGSANVARWIAVLYSVGFVAYFFVLFLGLRRSGHRHRWLAWPSREELRGTWAAASMPTFGFGILQGSRVIERMLASTVAVGGVASYYFAFRIFSAMQSIVGTSFATTGLTRMVEHDLAGEHLQLTRVVRRAIGRTLLLSTPVALGLILLSRPLVELLYGRGAFGAAAVEQTAQIVVWFGLGLPFLCMVPVLQSTLYARREYGLVLRNMATVATLNVVGAVLLSRSLGLPGIALSVSAAAIVIVFKLIYLLRRTGIRLLRPAKQVSVLGNAL